MRYYCKDCKSEIISGRDIQGWDGLFQCPICKGLMLPIPDFETPEQYEARTGKKISWHWSVWCKYPHFGWVAMHYNLTKDSDIIVCSNGPEPPPDDWLPEEVENGDL